MEGRGGCYPKDNKEGNRAIAGSNTNDFALYRGASSLQEIEEVKEGKGED